MKLGREKYVILTSHIPFESIVDLFETAIPKGQFTHPIYATLNRDCGTLTPACIGTSEAITGEVVVAKTE